MRTITLALCFVLAATAAQGAGKRQRLYRVEHVMVTMTRSLPPIVYFDIKAQAASAGWTRLRLRRIPMVRPPKDGVQDYEIVGIPPNGMAAQMIVPVRLRHHETMNVYDYWEHDKPLKGVRFLAKTNQILERMD